MLIGPADAGSSRVASSFLVRLKMAVTIDKATHRPGYVLKTECVVPRPMDEVFEFFANAANLHLLTPSWLRFKILTPLPIEMHKGRKIDYKLRVHGVPVHWTSEITAWEPNERFVDELRRGPYTHWHHEHRFEEREEGVHVSDVVHYGVPGGGIIHGLFVRRDLENIFNFRQQVLRERFGESSQAERSFPELATIS